jgi:hypothetical protein
MYIGVHFSRSCEEFIFRIIAGPSGMPNYLWFLPRLISLISMAEDTTNPQTPRRTHTPSHASRESQHTQGGPRHHPRRDHSPQQTAEKPSDIPEKEVGLDDEDTAQDREHHQSRSHRGKPPKKVYEEWANDPYCE